MPTDVDSDAIDSDAVDYDAVDYDAVIYDLDGTLVRLLVNWSAVRRELQSALGDRGLDVDGLGAWEILDLAEDAGFRHLAEDVLGRHEREGARRSIRLDLADELPLSVPVGVCSLNCESACRIALETHDLDDHVDAVSGRDSIERYKPDPEALLSVVDELGADPGETLFVGDSESDLATAEAAGVDFQWVETRLERE